MFTGLIEATGKIIHVSNKGSESRVRVESDNLDFSDVQLGDSIAVNGVCLTVVELTDNSFSADVSNELSHEYPEKYIVVAYRKGAISNLSLRGKGVKGILEKVLKEVEGRGGGHDDAVGAQINTDDLEKFRDAFERAIA